MNSPYSCVIYWQGLYKWGETRRCFTVGLFEATEATRYPTPPYGPGYLTTHPMIVILMLTYKIKVEGSLLLVADVESNGIWCIW